LKGLDMRSARAGLHVSSILLTASSSLLSMSSGRFASPQPRALRSGISFSLSFSVGLARAI